MDVGDWLRDLGLGQYEGFRQNSRRLQDQLYFARRWS